MKMNFNFRAAAMTMLTLALTACTTARVALTSAPPSTPQPTPAGGGAMDHGSMSGGMMNAPFDAMFIDGMIAHHEGAIAMANQALKEAQRPEIKTLAEEIIKAQQAEIEQMQTWRKAWYPDLKNTGGMQGMDMGPMTVVSGDARFDIRFIDAMIPHHESAIMMAKEAQQKADHAEIKQLADAIIKAQTAEIEQMTQWRAAWGK